MLNAIARTTGRLTTGGNKLGIKGVAALKRTVEEMSLAYEVGRRMETPPVVNKDREAAVQAYAKAHGYIIS